MVFNQKYIISVLWVLKICLLVLVSSTTDLNQYEKEPFSFCTSKSCLSIPIHILIAMDTSVDPCDDFYSFTCNNWSTANPGPKEVDAWSSFDLRESQSQYITKRVLEKPIHEMKSKAEKKAQIYYKSCMDAHGNIEKLGAKPIIKLIKEAGGWSITETGFNVDFWNLQDALQMLKNRMNSGVLFSWNVEIVLIQNKQTLIRINQDELTFPNRYHYLNRFVHVKVFEDYFNYMVEIGILLGGEETAVKQQMNSVIDFEEKLAKILMPSRPHNKTYPVTDINELNELAPFMDWQEYFNDVKKFANNNVVWNGDLVVHDREYLEQLTDLLFEYQSTDEKATVLNNYLIWRLVRQYVYYLSKNFTSITTELEKPSTNRAKNIKHWVHCVNQTNNNFDLVVGGLFVREAFNGDSKAHVTSIVHAVKVALIRNLLKLDWMDDISKDETVMKIESIIKSVGFSDFIKNPTYLDDMYRDLEVYADKYFYNNVQLNQLKLKRNWEELIGPVDKIRPVRAQTVNSYFDPKNKQMVLTAAMLQYPFYRRGYPASVNFGAIGSVIGHEFIHSIINDGSYVNEEWHYQSTDGFKNKYQCIKEQYSNYVVNNRNLNGTMTFNEDVADIGGVKAAYDAFLKYERNNAPLAKIPLMSHLTQHQMFFLSYAHVWCSTMSEENMELRYRKGLHSPHKFRVIGALSNLKEFSQAFKCRKGSRMNPKKQCNIW